MTFLMLIAALVSVAIDSWGRYLPLVVVVIVLGIVLRHFLRRADKMLPKRRRSGRNTGRTKQVNQLARREIGSVTKRGSDVRVLHGDVQTPSEFGGVVAHQEFGYFGEDALVDLLSRLPASPDKRYGYEVSRVEGSLELAPKARRVRSTIPSIRSRASSLPASSAPSAIRMR